MSSPSKKHFEALPMSALELQIPGSPGYDESKASPYTVSGSSPYDQAAVDEGPLPLSSKIWRAMGPVDKFKHVPTMTYRGGAHFSKCGICWTLMIYLAMLGYGIYQLFMASTTPLITSYTIKGMKEKIDFAGSQFCFIGGKNTVPFDPAVDGDINEYIAAKLSKKSKYGDEYVDNPNLKLEFVPYKKILEDYASNTEDESEECYSDETDYSDCLEEKKWLDPENAGDFPGYCVQVAGKAANINLESSIGISILSYEYFQGEKPDDPKDHSGDIIAIMAFYNYIKLNDDYVPIASMTSATMYQNKSNAVSFGMSYEKDTYTVWDSPIAAKGKVYNFSLLADNYILSSDGDIDLYLFNDGEKNVVNVQFTTIPTVIASVNGLLAIAFLGIGILFGGFFEMRYYENANNRVQNDPHGKKGNLFDRIVYTYGPLLDLLTCRSCRKKKPLATQASNKAKALKAQFDMQLELAHYLKKVR